MFIKKQKGFTLIELLVVIAIIAVLASIVLVSLNTARSKGRDARRVADLKSLQVALELFFDTNKRYPGSSAAGVEDTATLALAELKNQGFIPAIPKDPNGTDAYKYAWNLNTTIALGGASKYHLAAVLENKGSGPVLADADKLTADFAGGDNFDGKSVGCVAGDAATTDANEVCYDLTP